jgi:hypothetical protein
MNSVMKPNCKLSVVGSEISDCTMELYGINQIEFIMDDITAMAAQLHPCKGMCLQRPKTLQDLMSLCRYRQESTYWLHLGISEREDANGMLLQEQTFGSYVQQLTYNTKANKGKMHGSGSRLKIFATYFG